MPKYFRTVSVSNFLGPDQAYSLKNYGHFHHFHHHVLKILFYIFFAINSASFSKRFLFKYSLTVNFPESDQDMGSINDAQGIKKVITDKNIQCSLRCK